MKAIVYVEGVSDKAALTALLRPLIERKRTEGVSIEFFESPAGNKKQTLLTKIPIRAVDILTSNPVSAVVALPDLYPRNIGFKHETHEELRDRMNKEFRKAMASKRIEDDRLLSRFHVFCLKHDLEALLLATKEELLHRLGTSQPNIGWIEPVEDQNHDRPPKKVIEELFISHGAKYQGTVDAPLILGRADYLRVAERCPQCFRPFVEFLSNLAPAT